ncbi:MAG: hypothetical protein ACO259_09195 [Bacteroidia bacterium]
MEQLTCISWLHGKHSEDIEINTKLPYVAIYDYFAQEHHAEEVINEINKIYNTKNCTPLEACEIWAAYYL